MIERIAGQTPNGGAMATVAYLDDSFGLVDKASATMLELTEYDVNGEIIATTVMRKGQADGQPAPIPDDANRAAPPGLQPLRGEQLA